MVREPTPPAAAAILCNRKESSTGVVDRVSVVAGAHPRSAQILATFESNPLIRMDSTSVDEIELSLPAESSKAFSSRTESQRLRAPSNSIAGDETFEVLEFASVEYLTMEGDGDTVQMTITRRGAKDHTTELFWRTENVNINREYYVQQEGKVELKRGFSEATIDIHVRHFYASAQCMLRHHLMTSLSKSNTNS